MIAVKAFSLWVCCLCLVTSTQLPHCGAVGRALANATTQRSPRPSPHLKSPSTSPSPGGAKKAAPTPHPTVTSTPARVPLAQLPTQQPPSPPEPGMLPLPYYRSWSFPGPPPLVAAPGFNISLPQSAMKYYLEVESGIYRTPQNRHVYGPLFKLPSALLMKGTIQMAGQAVSAGTQGALFFHQELYYKGGAEMGWAYYCHNQLLRTYLCTNANIQGQMWSSFAAPDQSYVGKALSYRMDLFPKDRRSTTKVYGAAGALYTQAYNWPSWFQYNQSKPWYVTLTWQRNEDGPITGTVGNTSLWYLP